MAEFVPALAASFGQQGKRIFLACFPKAERVKGRLVQEECVKLLLNTGADPNLRDFGGMTPLKMANLHPKILSLIHKHQVNALTTQRGTQTRGGGREVGAHPDAGGNGQEGNLGGEVQVSCSSCIASSNVHDKPCGFRQLLQWCSRCISCF